MEKELFWKILKYFKNKRKIASKDQYKNFQAQNRKKIIRG